jgi:hypothetical protein
MRCVTVVVVGYGPRPGVPPWLPLPPVPMQGVCGQTFRSPRWLRRRAVLLTCAAGDDIA